MDNEGYPMILTEQIQLRTIPQLSKLCHFAKLLNIVTYKAALVGIDVNIVEEGYTSKCSFLDRETIKHHDHYLGKRVKRGLFQTQIGQLINADVNGAYNIIKKVVPKAFAVDGIEALGLVPQSILVT